MSNSVISAGAPDLSSLRGTNDLKQYNRDSEELCYSDYTCSSNATNDAAYEKPQRLATSVRGKTEPMISLEVTNEDGSLQNYHTAE